MAALQFSASVNSICQLLHVPTVNSPFLVSSLAPSTNIRYQKQIRKGSLIKAFLLGLRLTHSEGAQKCASWPAYKAGFPCSQKRGMATITEDLRANKGPCVRQSWLCLFCTNHNYSSARPPWECSAKWVQRKQPLLSCSFFVVSQSTWPVWV